MNYCPHCGKEIILPSKSMEHHPLKSVFAGMKRRCNNSKDKKYKRYGGRGISVCKEWLSNTKSFYSWCFENGWQKGLHLDRINNDGNYEPSNCRFVTNAENQKNKSNKRSVCYLGEYYSVSDLAKKFNMPSPTLWCRLYKYKMTVNQAIEKPVKKRDKSYRYKNK